MFRYLFLLREFVRRDFQSRYAGSVLGFVWSLLQPAWQLLLFGFVFSTVLKIPLIGERTDNFAIFLFCGLMPWLAMHEGIHRSSTAITDNANLVKKIHFPAEILVLSVVFGALLHQAIASGIFVGVLVASQQFQWSGLWLLLLAVPLQLGLTLGLGLLVASMNTFFRDVSQLLGMLLTGWFYFTPIVYPLKQVPEAYRQWVELNPAVGLVSLYRQAFLGGRLQDAANLWPTILATVLSLAIGGFLFQRLKPGFADEL